MRLGLIVRSDNSGLGTMSWEYARHLHPSVVWLVDNGVFQRFPERYQDTKQVSTYEALVDECDLILSIETFYNWALVPYARKKGVKTALVTMCEMSPDRFPYVPDLLICPSLLDYEMFKTESTKVVYLQNPVATDRLQWKKRTKARVFIHTASHGGMNGRKGTGVLLDAMKYVKGDIKLIIYAWKQFVCHDSRVEVKVVNFKNYWQLWQYGDVLIYPQGANGICLPIVEAMASGMGVITTDIYPFNEYMPKRLLFKPERTFKTRIAPRLREVEDVVINPVEIAKKIDYIFNHSIEAESLYGKEWSIKNSWGILLPEYNNVLNELCLL